MSKAIKKAIIRAATPSDVASIEALERASFEWAPEDAFSIRQIRGLLRNPRAIVRVAAADGKVLGWAAALLRQHASGNSGRVYAIAVHPDAQGMRLGRRLMERMLRELKTHSCRRVYLEVDESNAGAIALYDKLGLIRNKHLKDYYRKGRHAIHFVREIIFD